MGLLVLEFTQILFNQGESVQVLLELWNILADELDLLPRLILVDSFEKLGGLSMHLNFQIWRLFDSYLFGLLLCSGS